MDEPPPSLGTSRRWGSYNYLPPLPRLPPAFPMGPYFSAMTEETDTHFWTHQGRIDDREIENHIDAVICCPQENLSECQFSIHTHVCLIQTKNIDGENIPDPQQPEPHYWPCGFFVPGTRERARLAREMQACRLCGAQPRRYDVVSLGRFILNQCQRPLIQDAQLRDRGIIPHMLLSYVTWDWLFNQLDNDWDWDLGE